MAKWLKGILSAENEASSKRLICLVLVVVYVISHFMLMFIKIAIANERLVMRTLDGMEWMIMIFGGFILAEGLVQGYKIRQENKGRAEVIEAQKPTPPVQPPTPTPAPAPIIAEVKVEAENVEVKEQPKPAPQPLPAEHPLPEKKEPNKPYHNPDFIDE